MDSDPTTLELTRFAGGGGCACKIPPGELESVLAGLSASTDPDLLVGADDGDDAAVVRLDAGRAVISTVDFFTPIVNDPYDWGRIAATNALSDIYAMGGDPLVAVNILAWPTERLPLDISSEVLRGGADVAQDAGCLLAGGHSITAPEPIYGLAVTGLGLPDQLMRNDAGQPGMPLTLTKPIGIGCLVNRHQRTGEPITQAIQTMATLNREAAQLARSAGVTCATDVTGFGLLGHLYKLTRASNVTAILDADAIPRLDGAREAIRTGHVPGGTRRNLDWVRPHIETHRTEDELLLLADAQTSGGLLVCGELPGYPVVGELVMRREADIEVR